MKVEVFNHNTISDDFIGHVYIPIKELIDKPVPTWYVMQGPAVWIARETIFLSRRSHFTLVFVIICDFRFVQVPIDTWSKK